MCDQQKKIREEAAKQREQLRKQEHELRLRMDQMRREMRRSVADSPDRDGNLAEPNRAAATGRWRRRVPDW